MKTKFWTTISLALVVITMNAYSQRTIIFGNRVPWTTPPTDITSRPVYFTWNGHYGETASGTKLMNDVDTVYKAQLYFAPGANMWESALEPVSSTPRNFFSTEALAGFFSSATIPLVSASYSLAPGTPATLQVRVWDSAINTRTYDDAVSAGTLHSKSLIFNLGPSDQFMEGFQSFGCTLTPEPSSFALVLVGGGMAWVWRRMGRQAK